MAVRLSARLMRNYIPFVLIAVQWPRSAFTICSVKALPRVPYVKSKIRAWSQAQYT